MPVCTGAQRGGHGRRAGRERRGAGRGPHLCACGAARLTRRTRGGAWRRGRRSRRVESSGAELALAAGGQLVGRPGGGGSSRCSHAARRGSRHLCRSRAGSVIRVAHLHLMARRQSDERQAGGERDGSEQGERSEREGGTRRRGEPRWRGRKRRETLVLAEARHPGAHARCPRPPAARPACITNVSGSGSGVAPPSVKYGCCSASAADSRWYGFMVSRRSSRSSASGETLRAGGRGGRGGGQRA